MGKLRFRRVSKRGWDWAGGTATWPRAYLYRPGHPCGDPRCNECMTISPSYAPKWLPRSGPDESERDYADPYACSACHWYSP